MDPCITCTIAASSAANGHCLTVLLIALLVIFLAASALTLNRAVTGNSAMENTRQTISRVHQIGSEGRQAMDDLSEQYLNYLYKQVTANMEEIHGPNVWR